MTVKQTPWVFRPSPLRMDSIVFFRCLAYGRADASVVDAELPMAPHRNPEELCDPWKIAGVFVFREIFLSKAFFLVLVDFSQNSGSTGEILGEILGKKMLEAPGLCQRQNFVVRIWTDWWWTIGCPDWRGMVLEWCFVFFLNNHGCYS